MTRATFCLALLIAFLLATACAEPVPYRYLLPSDPELRAQAEALADLHKQLPEAETPVDWDRLQTQIEALQVMYGDVCVLIAYYGNEEFSQEDIDAAYATPDGLKALLSQSGKAAEGKRKMFVYPITVRSVLARLYFLQADWRGVLDATVPLLGGDWAEWSGWLGWPVPVPHLLADLALRKLGKPGLAGPSGVPSPTLCDWYNCEADYLRWATLQPVAGDVELLKLAEERLNEAAGHLGEDFDVLRWHVAKPPELKGYDLNTREGRFAAKDRLGLEGVGDYIYGLQHWSLASGAKRAAAARGLLTGDLSLCKVYVDWIDEQCERQFAAVTSVWLADPELSPRSERTLNALSNSFNELVYRDARQALLDARLATPLVVRHVYVLGSLIEQDGARYVPLGALCFGNLLQSLDVDKVTGWVVPTGYMLNSDVLKPLLASRIGDKHFELLPGTRQARILGQPYELAHPVFFKHGMLMVSEEDWNALFKLKCKWDPDRQTLDVSGYEPSS